MPIGRSPGRDFLYLGTLRVEIIQKLNSKLFALRAEIGECPERAEILQNLFRIKQIFADSWTYAPAYLFLGVAFGEKLLKN